MNLNDYFKESRNSAFLHRKPSPNNWNSPLKMNQAFQLDDPRSPMFGRRYNSNSNNNNKSKSFVAGEFDIENCQPFVFDIRSPINHSISSKSRHNCHNQNWLGSQQLPFFNQTHSHNNINISNNYSQNGLVSPISTQQHQQQQKQSVKTQGKSARRENLQSPTMFKVLDCYHSSFNKSKVGDSNNNHNNSVNISVNSNDSSIQSCDFLVPSTPLPNNNIDIAIANNKSATWSNDGNISSGNSINSNNNSYNSIPHRNIVQTPIAQVFKKNKPVRCQTTEELMEIQAQRTLLYQQQQLQQQQRQQRQKQQHQPQTTANNINPKFEGMANDKSNDSSFNNSFITSNTPVCSKSSGSDYRNYNRNINNNNRNNNTSHSDSNIANGHGFSVCNINNRHNNKKNDYISSSMMIDTPAGKPKGNVNIHFQPTPCTKITSDLAEVYISTPSIIDYRHITNAKFGNKRSQGSEFTPVATAVKMFKSDETITDVNSSYENINCTKDNNNHNLLNVSACSNVSMNDSLLEQQTQFETARKKLFNFTNLNSRPSLLSFRSTDANSNNFHYNDIFNNNINRIQRVRESRYVTKSVRRRPMKKNDGSKKTDVDNNDEDKDGHVQKYFSVFSDSTFIITNPNSTNGNNYNCKGVVSSNNSENKNNDYINNNNSVKQRLKTPKRAPLELITNQIGNICYANALNFTETPPGFHVCSKFFTKSTR